MKTVKHKIACILLATFAASAAFADDPYIASTADGTFYAIVGESVSCEVENVPLGMMVIIR